VPGDCANLEAIEATLKKAAAALKAAGVPFMLGGSLAYRVRGAAECPKDLDLMLRPQDAERALAELSQAGMRSERPPEDWLLKTRDGDVLVDLIFRPMGMTIDDEVFARSELLNVFSIEMPVMALEDVMTSKLLALNEHALDYEPLLQLARPLRERIDWNDVAARTRSSPYARAFFALLAELGIAHVGSDRDGKHIRVAPARALP
jgi:hypothetical protein